uniref:Uncharacterized protein n=1 Tax=Silurid herpesvirus 2 TaxID=2978071 RepID=A0A977TNA7_9VIRU|nr:hypothetical protein [Silurid herpesvirus 2]
MLTCRNPINRFRVLLVNDFETVSKYSKDFFETFDARTRILRIKIFVDATASILPTIKVQRQIGPVLFLFVTLYLSEFDLAVHDEAWSYFSTAAVVGIPAVYALSSYEKQLLENIHRELKTDSRTVIYECVRAVRLMISTDDDDDDDDVVGYKNQTVERYPNADNGDVHGVL